MSSRPGATLALALSKRRTAEVLAWLFTLLAGTGSAFELERVSGNPCDFDAQDLFWPAAQAPVSIENLRPSDAAIAEVAISRWNESVAVFRFLRAGGRVCDAGDGIVTLAAQDRGCNGESLGDLLGVTRLRWDIPSGRLLDADIVLGPQSVAHGQAIFLQVALHELGHALGLAHSDECGSSGAGTLMQTELVLSQARLDRPQPDDINGANFIYGTGGSGNVPDGANSCAIEGPKRAWRPWPLLGVILLWATRHLRRNRCGQSSC